jgi:hypothetical protein
MEEMITTQFNGPIPGSSLTNELGNNPTERPPKFVDPEEAYEDTANRLTSPEVFERVSVASELGIPVELTVRSIVFSGWANGRYPVDVMYLIYGPLFELTMAMLDDKGVNYLPLAKRREDKEYVKALDLLSEIKGMQDSTDEARDKVSGEEETDTEMMEIEEDKDTLEVPRGGLMGRAE